MSKKKVQTVRTKHLGPRFARNFQALRERNKITRAEAARKLLLSPSMITKMESTDLENRRDPSLFTVEAAAKLFHVDPAALLKAPPKKAKKSKEETGNSGAQA